MLCYSYVNVLCVGIRACGKNESRMRGNELGENSFGV